MINESKLWLEFKREFVHEIQTKGLTEKWFNLTYRTNYYMKEILPPIAEKMKFKQTTELFKVDAVFAKKENQNSWEIPVIFIESENNIITAEHEIDKLCCLSAPLRILITAGNIDNCKVYIEEWGSLIKSYSEVWKNKGILGLIIADYSFNFYAMAWGENGDQIEKLELICSNPKLEIVQQ